MTSNIILVFTSPDRPGVIEKLTSVVVEQGGNWEESRLARLCGDFAGIVRITIHPAELERLTERMDALAEEGIAVYVKPANLYAGTPNARSARLACSGADHEGIVNRLAAYLARQGINVEEMETEVEPAPITGTPVFRMNSLITIPAEFDLRQLQENLNELASQLAIDLTLDGEAC